MGFFLIYCYSKNGQRRLKILKQYDLFDTIPIWIGVIPLYKHSTSMHPMNEMDINNKQRQRHTAHKCCSFIFRKVMKKKHKKICFYF